MSIETKDVAVNIVPENPEKVITTLKEIQNSLELYKTKTNLSEDFLKRIVTPKQEYLTTVDNISSWKTWTTIDPNTWSETQKNDYIASMTKCQTLIVDLLGVGPELDDFKSIITKDGVQQKLDISDTKKLTSQELLLLKTKTPPEVAVAFGYTWDVDKYALAKNAGIVGYTGTEGQNQLIKDWLLRNSPTVVEEEKIVEVVKDDIVKDKKKEMNPKKEENPVQVNEKKTLNLSQYPGLNEFYNMEDLVPSSLQTIRNEAVEELSGLTGTQKNLLKEAKFTGDILSKNEIESFKSDFSAELSVLEKNGGFEGGKRSLLINQETKNNGGQKTYLTNGTDVVSFNVCSGADGLGYVSTTSTFETPGGLFEITQDGEASSGKTCTVDGGFGKIIKNQAVGSSVTSLNNKPNMTTAILALNGLGIGLENDDINLRGEKNTTTFQNHIYLHGTGKESSVINQTRTSHGCLRHDNITIYLLMKIYKKQGDMNVFITHRDINSGNNNTDIETKRKEFLKLKGVSKSFLNKLTYTDGYFLIDGLKIQTLEGEKEGPLNNIKKIKATIEGKPYTIRFTYEGGYYFTDVDGNSFSLKNGKLVKNTLLVKPGVENYKTYQKEIVETARNYSNCPYDTGTDGQNGSALKSWYLSGKTTNTTKGFGLTDEEPMACIDLINRSLVDVFGTVNLPELDETKYTGERWDGNHNTWNKNDKTSCYNMLRWVNSLESNTIGINSSVTNGENESKNPNFEMYSYTNMKEKKLYVGDIITKGVVGGKPRHIAIVSEVDNQGNPTKIIHSWSTAIGVVESDFNKFGVITKLIRPSSTLVGQL